MADIFTSDFEGGTPFSVWTTAAASVSQDTGTFHGGAASAKHDGTVATDPLLTKTIAGSPTALVVQFWFYVPTSMPGGYTGVTIARIVCNFFNIYFKLNNTSTFELQAQLDNGTTQWQQTATYTEGEWHQVTMRANMNPAPISLDWNVDGSEKTQVASSGGTTFATAFNLGYAGAAATGLVFYTDDVRVGNAAGDYETYKGSAVSTASRMALLGVG